jgi:hypothetical protein
MKAVKAYYDGQSFIPSAPITIPKNAEAIITILDFMPVKKREGEKSNYKRTRLELAKKGEMILAERHGAQTPLPTDTVNIDWRPAYEAVRGDRFEW